MTTNEQARQWLLARDITNVWGLSGRHNAKARQELGSILAGRKVTQSESGVNALRHLLFKAANVPSDCLAIQERHLAAWIKGETYTRKIYVAYVE